MTENSLRDTLQSVESPVFMLRHGQTKPFPEVENEYTSWIEEQRAWREGCSLADQSHHMTDLWIEGPDALDLLADLGINDFSDFPVGRAKQFVACNPDGYVIGDGVLPRLDETRYVLIGRPPACNWVQYHAETGDYDISIERDGNSIVRDGPPKNFRYQLQGPDALDVMEATIDGSLPELSFFGFAELSIDGIKFKALRHTMAGEPGFEFWGPWEYADDIKNAVMDAGEDYGIRHLGTKSYVSASSVSGWIADPLPAIYNHKDLADYREWLDADDFEAVSALGGSFTSEDITDYYLSPVALGYEHIINRDHDYVGRDAVVADLKDPSRKRVTLVWDSEDVVDVFASLFEEGATKKFMDLPEPWWAAMHYDEVIDGDATVGISKFIGYNYNERKLLSLACLDTEYAEPGTEVTVVWGEEDSPNPAVERHVETEISATVAPAPYSEDRR